VADVGFATWIVLVRFAAADRAAVQEAADRAGREGGFALVLDGQSGSALQAVAPIEVEGGRSPCVTCGNPRPGGSSRPM